MAIERDLSLDADSSGTPPEVDPVTLEFKSRILPVLEDKSLPHEEKVRRLTEIYNHDDFRGLVPKFRDPSDFVDPSETKLLIVHRSLKELKKSIVADAEKGLKRDLLPDMRDYLRLQQIRVEAEHQGVPDPNKILVVTPNHYTRNAVFTTGESLNMVALSAVGAFNAEVTFKHTAWIIKQLDIHKAGPGILDRKVQNAAITCYGQIPIKVERRLVKGRFGLPQFREIFANINEFQGLVFKNIMDGNNIGYFPEQTPTRELKQFDPNYPRFIRGMQKNTGEFEILPVSNYYEGNIAHVRFGQVIQVTRDADPSEVAGLTMRRIAGNLPRNLRSAYS